MTNKFKKITLKDLLGLYSLKEWIKESTGLFHNKKISKSNMLIIIDYLIEVFKKPEVENREPWLRSLNKLKGKIERMDE